MGVLRESKLRWGEKDKQEGKCVEGRQGCRFLVFGGCIAAAANECLLESVSIPVTQRSTITLAKFVD